MATVLHKAVSRGGQSTPQERSARGGNSRRWTAWLFLLPLLLVNLLVILGPSVATLYYSFTNWTGVGGAKFIGLANYTRAFRDPDLREALWHNLIWFVLFLIVPSALGLLGAFLLSRITRFQMLFRTIYFIPYVTASVVNAAVWKMLLNPTNGVGIGLSHIGIPFLKNVSFFGDPNLALYSVNFVVDWHWWGFLAVIYLAAMQGVDHSLYDAAKVDGANAWREFRHITIPGIRPTLVFMALMTVIWSLKVFDYVYIITRGGPGSASQVVSTLMYDDIFNKFEAGYAAAIGLSMSFVVVIVLFGYFLLRKRDSEI
jgi:raffinose/stachyose/melibiose transport system permease protein